MPEPGLAIAKGGGEHAEASMPADRSLVVKALASVSDVLDRLAVLVVAALMASLVSVMFVGVIYRYVLNNALPWTEEIAGFAMGWLVFIGAAILFRHDGHPSSRLLPEMLRGRLRRTVESVAEALTGIYLVILIGAGLNILGGFLPHSPALSLSYGLALQL